MAEKITFELDLNDPAVWDDSALVNSWNDALGEYKVSTRLWISSDQALTCWSRNITASMLKGRNWKMFLPTRS